MDQKALASLDPKLRETYERVMGTSLTPNNGQASPQNAPQAQPQTVQLDTSPTPPPANDTQPPVGPLTENQQNDTPVAPAPDTQPPTTPSSNPAPPSTDTTSQPQNPPSADPQLQATPQPENTDHPVSFTFNTPEHGKITFPLTPAGSSSEDKSSENPKPLVDPKALSSVKAPATTPPPVLAFNSAVNEGKGLKTAAAPTEKKKFSVNPILIGVFGAIFLALYALFWLQIFK